MSTQTTDYSSAVECHDAFLRWAGSKRQIVHRLSAFWHRRHFDRYVEPFCGSSSLFFRIRPSAALLADKNSQLMEVYAVVREDPEAVYQQLRNLPKSKELYLRLRAQDPHLLTRLSRATRFLYLNAFCFNGIYRTNTAGHFNVPYASGCGQLPSFARLRACASALQTAELRDWDFGTTLRYVRKNDFVYVDPPYAVESRRVFKEYGAKTFSADDLDRLAEHLRKVHDKGAFFLLSYADCRDIRDVMCDWPIRRIRVRRHIAGFANNRRHAFEVLVTNIPNEE